MKYKIHFVAVLLILKAWDGSLYSQELNCTVSVNATRIETSDRAIFEDMQTAFTQFMSTRKWTDDLFLPEERINCNLIITLNEMPNIGNFNATVQIQSARPVYNSNYESIVLNFIDQEWEFQYIQSQPIEFSENTYINNLSSLLAYYAYIIIGFDYDTFSELGGTPYFQRAQDIVNNAAQSNRAGWDSFGKTRNRYWFSENLNNPQMVAIRKGMYTYHRLAIDQFEKDADASRATITTALKEISDVKDRYPNSILLRAFIDAKADELVNIFSEGDLQTRRQAFDALSKVSPAQTDKFRQIVQ